jgi:hypothetical protein
MNPPSPPSTPTGRPPFDVPWPGGTGAARDAALAGIGPLDPVALASVVGGLMLVPDNLHHAHRFEVVANMVLAGRAQGRGDVTRTRARRVIDELVGEWTGHNDDPWPTLATEAFVYHGGTHLFVPGGIDTTFILRAVARAIEDCADKRPDLQERASRIIQFACVLSDDVLARVGAQRNQRVPVATSIVVPPDSALRRLRDAVRLEPDRLERLRRTAGIPIVDRDRFIITIGSATEREPLESYALLTRTPLARKDPDVVVIAPHLIAEAAIRNVLALAVELEAHDLLAREFHRVTWHATDDALRLLGMNRIWEPRAEIAPTPATHVTHAVYQCDRDKAHHVMLVSDALEGAPGDPWDSSAIEAELRRVQSALVAVLAGTEPPIAAWTSVVITSGIGREFAFRFTPGDVPCWSASAADLEAIAHAEGRDSLLLWKHTEALAEFRRTTLISSWSPLDTYALWKASERRFVRDIAPLPTMISIAPDLAEVVRREAVTKRDWRALPSWTDDGVVEVAIAEDPERPIYAPRGLRPKRLTIAVETPGPLVWLVSPEKRDLSVDGEARRLCAEIVRMAAFWLSEFTKALATDVRTVAATPPVIVDCEVAPGDVASAYEITVTAPRRVRVAIGRTFYEAYDATNRAERAFAADLTTAVLEAAGLSEARARVHEQLDGVAPVGVKRMLHAIRDDRYPSFVAAHELPPRRYVSDYDIHRARRVALGAGASPTVTLEGRAAKDWLNGAVGRLYDALREQLGTLDGADALRDLLLRNEALVHEDDERDLTFASVLACAEGTVGLKRNLVERVSRHSRAATATRFLIEHVVAEPPRGQQLVNFAHYDRLLALAAEIIALGVSSDAINFELAGPAARVVVGATGYDVYLDGYKAALDEGRKRVFTERFELEAGRAAVAGAEPPRKPTKRAPTDNLSAGVEAEFGRSLQDIAFFLGELLALAREGQRALVVEPRSSLVEHLASRLEWPAAAVESLVQHFVLEPRAAFLTAPEPYKSSDVSPWRFNRGLSYLRRPLVRTPDDSIFFTPGNVAKSAENLVQLIVTGRYKAQTEELRARMDAFNQGPAREFVADVANTLEARGFITRTHVNKIGKQRIEKATGHDAGDVDVLAADRTRRRIFAIECKDLTPDRMPNEIRADLEMLFIGSPGKKEKPSAQAKHLTRLRWLREHHDEVVAWLLGERGESWTIEAAIVTSRPLVSRHLGFAKMPVWTLAECRRGEGP